jgi:acetylornithine deacetylase/succinyl-diaminopimelate desuccinylase-like protein
MTDIVAQINQWVVENREDCIRFLQDFISIPSPSYDEAEAARFLAGKMNEFNYTTARVDALNDAMGTIKGTDGGRSFLLNGHIDHVPVGDMVDPYSGKIMDGEELGDHGDVIYGRAACDMKAAVAAMVLAGRALNELGIRLKGDYNVAGTPSRRLVERGQSPPSSTVSSSRTLCSSVRQRTCRLPSGTGEA